MSEAENVGKVLADAEAKIAQTIITEKQEAADRLYKAWHGSVVPDLDLLIDAVLDRNDWRSELF